MVVSHSTQAKALKGIPGKCSKSSRKRGSRRAPPGGKVTPLPPPSPACCSGLPIMVIRSTRVLVYSVHSLAVQYWPILMIIRVLVVNNLMRIARTCASTREVCRMLPTLQVRMFFFLGKEMVGKQDGLVLNWGNNKASH